MPLQEEKRAFGGAAAAPSCGPLTTQGAASTFACPCVRGSECVRVRGWLWVSVCVKVAKESFLEYTKECSRDQLAGQPEGVGEGETAASRGLPSKSVNANCSGRRPSAVTDVSCTWPPHAVSYNPAYLWWALLLASAFLFLPPH